MSLRVVEDARSGRPAGHKVTREPGSVGEAAAGRNSWSGEGNEHRMDVTASFSIVDGVIVVACAQLFTRGTARVGNRALQ